ncbi:MAG: sugar ABC transporter ATP-binding protein [Clostridiales bacterium]|nr:sugar ABC transporter ATP-binding protein [Clostridiales bacterium]
MNTIYAENITKIYPGTKALDGVSCHFEGGKINALLGKNGSGKSTLVKIFAGAEIPTEGMVRLGDKTLRLSSTLQATQEGIVLVYQETSLVPTLSVVENIFLGRLPRKPNGLIDWKAARVRAAELMDGMGLHINPRALIQHLPMWQRQVIEICKALSHDPKVLILDEPTSALAKDEVQKLFQAIRRIKDRGVVVIYISHKLAEVNEIADTVTVLRDGVYVGSRDIRELTNAGMIHMMFGDVRHKVRPAESVPTDEVIMEVNGLTRAGWYEDVSFKLYRGEVLGIAGMLGSGRTELLNGIFGSMPADSGTVTVGGKTYARRSPVLMKGAGVGLTPEDRKVDGLILMHSIESNLCYAGMRRTTVGGWVESTRKRRAMAQRQVDALHIKLSGLNARASSMSGGNQQKVVVGNWLNNDPSIMIYDEPTRGIDVHAKQQIFEIMWAQSILGHSSIFVSTEIEELLGVCHRILIMRGGRIVDELKGERLQGTHTNDLYTLCLGG